MRQGYNAMLLVLVMRDDASCFLPNQDTDPDFSLEFWNAVKEGLKIQVKTFRLIENKIVIPLCKINLI